jgi:hypothetical protein
MLDRADVLRKFHYSWPSFDAAWLAAALRGLMAVTLIAGLVWLLNLYLRRRAGFGAPGDSPELR